MPKKNKTPKKRDSDDSAIEATDPNLSPLEAMDRNTFVYNHLVDNPTLSGAWIKFGPGGHLIRIDKPDATDNFNDLRSFSKEDGIFPALLVRMLVSSDGKKIGPGPSGSDVIGENYHVKVTASISELLRAGKPSGAPTHPNFVQHEGDSEQSAHQESALKMMSTADHITVREVMDHNQAIDEDDAPSAKDANMSRETFKAEKTVREFLANLSTNTTIDKFKVFYGEHAHEYPGAPKTFDALPKDHLPTAVLELVIKFVQDFVDTQGGLSSEVNVNVIAQCNISIALAKYCGAGGTQNSYQEVISSGRTSTQTNGSEMKSMTVADLQALLDIKSAESARNRTEHLTNSDLVALENNYSPHMTLTNTFTSSQVNVATVKDPSGEIYGLWSLSHANTVHKLMQSPERYLTSPVEMKWRMILKGIEESIWDLLLNYIKTHIGHTWSNLGTFLAEATAMTRAFEGDEFSPFRGLTHCFLADTHTILMNKIVTPAVGFVSSRINTLRAILLRNPKCWAHNLKDGRRSEESMRLGLGDIYLEMMLIDKSYIS